MLIHDNALSKEAKPEIVENNSKNMYLKNDLRGDTINKKLIQLLAHRIKPKAKTSRDMRENGSLIIYIVRKKKWKNFKFRNHELITSFQKTRIQNSLLLLCDIRLRST